MASKAVVDAVEAKLAAEWSATAIVGLNARGEPPALPDPYIVVQYPLANAEQGSFGSPGTNLVTEEGAFRIVILVAIGDGVATALTYADSLTEMFRNQNFAGVQTWIPTPPVFDDRNEDGSRYKVSLAIPYRYDSFVG